MYTYNILVIDESETDQTDRMHFNIKEYSRPGKNGMKQHFRIEWCNNGVRGSKCWRFNDTNRAEQLAKAEEFRRQLIASTPELIRIAEIKSVRRSRFCICWTENHVSKRKDFEYTDLTYASQKAKAEAFRDALQKRLYC